MTCGIYLIFCKDLPYIGQSSNIENRIYDHERKLRYGTHNNPIMQNTFNKYGPSVFEYSILECCSVSSLTDREQYWYEEFDSYEKGCNLTFAVDSPTRGVNHSEETKKILSEQKKGRVDGKRKFDENSILSIWERYMSGEAALSIGIDLKVGNAIIWNIVNRRYYKEINLPPSCREKPYYRKGGGRKKKNAKKLFVSAGISVSQDSEVEEVSAESD